MVGDFDPKKDLGKELAVNNDQLMDAVRQDAMQYLAHCVSEMGGKVVIPLPLKQNFSFSAKYNTRTEVLELTATNMSAGGIMLPRRN